MQANLQATRLGRLTADDAHTLGVISCIVLISWLRSLLAMSLLMRSSYDPTTAAHFFCVRYFMMRASLLTERCFTADILVLSYTLMTTDLPPMRLQLAE